MKQIYFEPIVFFLLLTSMACSKAKPEITTKGGELNLLSKSHNIGMIVGFNFDNSAATTDSINARWGEAISAGMSVGRLQIDWPDIETAEGVYNVALVEDLLGNYHALGLQTHVLISAYDSEGPDVPAYLQGLDFDNERVINSFKNLMDWSPGTVAIISEAYEADTPQWFIDQYGRVLETLGMIDFETGERKLAWNEIMQWIEKFN